MESSQLFIEYAEQYIQRPGIHELLEWINSTDFYTCPASTRYHGSYEGGLVDHSLNVFEQMLFELDTLVGPSWEKLYSIESVAIIALFHDLCKIGRYTTQTKWRKDDYGQWESYEAYVYDPEKAEMGHGPQSVFYIQQYMQLTEEEAQAIFWHMGAYDISPYASLNGLSKTFEQQPLAFLIHRADMAATYAVENEHFEFAKGDEPDVANERTVEPVDEPVVRRDEYNGTNGQSSNRAVGSNRSSNTTNNGSNKTAGAVSGRITRKSDPVPEPDNASTPEPEKIQRKGNSIRMPKPSGKVENDTSEPETEESIPQEENVTTEETYWYNQKTDELYILDEGTTLSPEEINLEGIIKLTAEEYDDMLNPVLEEDFFYLLPDDTVGVIREGERLPEDYDENTYNPITEQEYLDRKALEVKPAITAKARSRKTPSPSRRPK